jgi:hypothetical protein
VLSSKVFGQHASMSGTLALLGVGVSSTLHAPQQQVPVLAATAIASSSTMHVLLYRTCRPCSKAQTNGRLVCKHTQLQPQLYLL